MAIKISGTAGKDIFIATGEENEYDGLAGYDIVSYEQSAAAIRLELENAIANLGDAYGDTFVAIENFKLSRFDDVFIGSARNDVVNGDAGNDRLEGRGGNDSLTGHSGHDTIYGGDGHDSIWGGGNNDRLYGEAGNDQIWGDSHIDVISGGTDFGRTEFTATPKQYYAYTSTILIPLEQIDDYGEWVVVPKRTSILNGGVLTSINRVEGDAIFVVTNGFSDARDWNATPLGRPTIDLGPGGEIPANSSIIFNAGPGLSTVLFSGTELGFPAVKASGSNAEGVVTRYEYTFSSITVGDRLTGGSYADTFIYSEGDGVDQINDFAIGEDRINVIDKWFDGNAANGEYAVREYNGGALVMFTDTSADGYVDDAAIHLVGISAANVTAAIFI